MNKEAAAEVLEREASKACRSWTVSKSSPEPIILRCKNLKCTWRASILRNSKGWHKSRKWQDSHVPGCVNDGPKTGICDRIKRRATRYSAVCGDGSTKTAITHYNLLSRNTKDMSNPDGLRFNRSTEYMRAKHCLTPKGRKNFSHNTLKH